ncbi:MAG: PEP-CTERM sorting domain-containing protein [Planctomycetes bacterium]|nr:PEP-CTERM sorting domain-containing protein [Planctomycetota bacterium]MCB9884068.1 PEP-CTERM sorting domain-containing protein [Planctomycetota bacterium]
MRTSLEPVFDALEVARSRRSFRAAEHAEVEASEKEVRMFAIGSLLLCVVVAPVSDSVSHRAGCDLTVPQDAPRKPVAPPGGGTPEPTAMLLLAGGALGYGILRLGRKRPGDSDKRE